MKSGLEFSHEGDVPALAPSLRLRLHPLCPTHRSTQVPALDQPALPDSPTMVGIQTGTRKGDKEI